MKKAILAGAAFLASTSFAAAETVDGHWAVQLASCTAEFTDDVLRINTAEGWFQYYESSCEIVAWNPLGSYGGAWSATLACSGEGDTWTTKAIIGLFQSFDETPDRLAIIDTGEGWTTIWQRCGDTAP